MHAKQRFSSSFFYTISRAATLALTIAIVFALMMSRPNQRRPKPSK